MPNLLYPPVSRSAQSSESVLVSRRELVELYQVALELQRLTDEANRLRIDVTAATRKLENILRHVAPGLVLEVTLGNEPTPIVPPPKV